MRKSRVLPVFVLLCVFTLAACAPTSTEAGSDRGWIGVLWDPVWNLLFRKEDGLIAQAFSSTVKGILSTAMLAVFTWAGAWMMSRFKLLRKKWPVLFTRSKKNQATILLLGRSKAGKSTLIRRMFGVPSSQRDPNPERPTDKPSLFNMLHETRGESSAELCRLDVIDYAGGKSEEFIRDWLALSKNTYSNEPKAVILMLAWGPPGSTEAAEFNKDLRYWSENSAELLREAAKTVLRQDGKVFAKLFLFINKMDLAPANKLSAKALLSDYELKTEAEELPAQLQVIWDEVQPLVRLYQKAFRGQEAIVVFGSALHGVKVAEMLDLIR